MPQSGEGVCVLPLGSPTTEFDDYFMCAAPALARAATIHDKKTPFREVPLVLAIEVSAELAELSLRLPELAVSDLQSRGAMHCHTLLWTSKMIMANTSLLCTSIDEMTSMNRTALSYLDQYINKQC